VTVRQFATSVACVLLVFSSGAACFRSKLPPLEQYRLTPAAEPASIAAPSAVGPLPGSVAASRFGTPGVYGGPQIVDRVGDTGYGTYPNREWALPLGEMLGMLAEETIRAEPLGTAVVYDPASRRQFAYEWRGAVRQFEEVNRDGRVYASVQLEARLLRMADDSILWLGERRVELPVEDPSMTHIVEALSAAARQAMRELVLDAKTAARSVAAEHSPP
jgi:ABC-type uncharacterized transport system auxiliary subunit